MAAFTLQGTSLVTLPEPDQGGVTRSPVKYGSEQRSVTGTLTSQVISRKQQWSLSFGLLTDAEYDLLLQFDDGRQGLGPFTFKDPRDGAGVSYQVQLPIDSALNDSSQMMGYRMDVVLQLVEV